MYQQEDKLVPIGNMTQVWRYDIGVVFDGNSLR